MKSFFKLFIYMNKLPELEKRFLEWRNCKFEEEEIENQDE